MADVSTKMRMGEFIRYIDPDNQFLSNYNGIIHHYKEFADALLEYQHTIDYMEDKTFQIMLGDIELPQEVLTMLQHSLQKTHFQWMVFGSNEIDGVGYFNSIANCMKANTRLYGISLAGLTIEHSRDIDLLWKL